MRVGEETGIFRGRLGSLWEGLNSTFWFVLSLIMAGCVVLFGATLWLDHLAQMNLAVCP